jgi:predicted ferric reductase
MTASSTLPRDPRPSAAALLPGVAPAGSPARRRAIVLADLLAALAGLGLGITLVLGIHAETLGSLHAPGGIATALGRMTGLVGTYLMLIEIALIARLPWLERAVGQDRLVGWHRRIGPWPIVLLLAHGLLITVGYAAVASTGLLREFWVLLTTFPNVLAAVVSLGLLVTAGVSSYRLVRRRVSHETWWAIHLYTYLAAALGLAHQMTAGAAFIHSPLARVWWLTMWAATAGLVLVYRVVRPIWRSLRHGLRVVEVRPEGPGVVSVILKGRNLAALRIRGGQFFQWRFLRPGLWWQAHPYSLSAMPQGPYLRLTVKALGDHSTELATIPVGTRVAVEGPYGVLTRDVRTGNRVLLVAGGVGVTPLRALLEDLPPHADVVVVMRASRHEDVVFGAEMRALVEARGGHLHVLVGSRHKIRFSPANLRQLVPDILLRDVYLCGPEGMVDEVIGSAVALGVPDERIHLESFSF